MQALIKVTSNADGSQVVSARDLHIFLEVKTRLDNWMNRMIEYGFTEDVDFQRVYKIGQTVNGKPKNVFEDCILTLDTAKHISMIQRTEKGMQARQYFIECEKKLTQVKQVVQPAVEKLQARVRQLEAKLDAAERSHQNELKNLQFRLNTHQSQLEFYKEHCNDLHDQWRNAEDRYFKESDRNFVMIDQILDLQDRVKALKAVKPAGEASAAESKLPPLSTGTKINRLVRQYAADNAENITFEQTWKLLYREFRDRFHIDPSAWHLKKGETIIGRIDQLGKIEELLLVAEYLFAGNQQQAA